MAGPESEQKALQGSMVKTWIQGGEKNSASGCNPSTTAFTCNRVTFQFIVRLIQATSLHTTSIYPSLPWERQKVQGRQRHVRGGRATSVYRQCSIHSPHLIQTQKDIFTICQILIFPPLSGLTAAVAISSFLPLSKARTCACKVNKG